VPCRKCDLHSLFSNGLSTKKESNRSKQRQGIFSISPGGEHEDEKKEESPGRNFCVGPDHGIQHSRKLHPPKDDSKPNKPSTGRSLNCIALRKLTGDRAKYFGLIFAIAFSTFLLQNQTSIFVGVMLRTGSQIADVTDAEVWVMDPAIRYFEQTKALKGTDLLRVRGVPGVGYAVRLFKGQMVVRTLKGNFSQGTVMGIDDATLVGAPRKMLLGSWERLREPDSVLIDLAGYHLLFPGEPLELDRALEVNNHLARIVGISDASTPCAA